MTQMFEKFDNEQFYKLYGASIASLSGFTIGDVFLEQFNRFSIVLHNGIFKNRIEDSQSGYAVRGVQNTKDIVFINNSLDFNEIVKDLDSLKNLSCDKAENFVEEILFPAKNISFPAMPNSELENFLLEVQTYLHKCSLIKDIQIVFTYKLQKVLIINNFGRAVFENRFYCSLRMTILVEKNNKKNTFSEVLGSKKSLQFVQQNWPIYADTLIKRAEVMIDAKDTVSGTFPVLFGKGSPGVLIHEAVGHSLEGDFHRLETSVFSGKIGQQIASKITNIVDDSTLEQFGFIDYDDEGTKAKKNLLIENGILLGCLWDRKNAALAGCLPTGSGRRQSFKTLPIPRMTNTFVETYDGTSSTFQEMRSVYAKFIFVKDVTHGAVDISSGQFSFTASEAYLHENGVDIPLAECVFSGMGSDVLQNIEKIEKSDGIEFDVGHCGKNGSWVPVACGQPSILVSKIVIG